MPDTAEAPAGIAEDLINWAAKHIGFFSPPPKKKRADKAKAEVIGSAQKKRAGDTYKELSKEDQTKFDGLKKSAKNDTEKSYLDKALASQYSVKDIESFAKKINGKDAKWMQDNLKLTGNSKGEGIKQQWQDSCNATTVQAIRGQLDPIYALKLHEENEDVSKASTDPSVAKPDVKNKKLAAEQKSWLESKTDGTGHAGKAVARGKGGGSGRWGADLMNNLSDVTGVEYTNQIVDGTKYKLDDAIKDINKGLKVGHPVPIVIGNPSNPNQRFQHYVLVTGATSDAKSWLIHDPYGGKMHTVTLANIKANKVNVAG